VLERVAGLQDDSAQDVRLVAEMAIDGLLADPGGLGDAVDRGPLIALRQELSPADIQQVVDPAGLPVVLVAGCLLGRGDDRKSCLRVALCYL
jgi:hypothetical protein